MISIANQKFRLSTNDFFVLLSLFFCFTPCFVTYIYTYTKYYITNSKYLITAFIELTWDEITQQLIELLVYYQMP